MQIAIARSHLKIEIVRSDKVCGARAAHSGTQRRISLQDSASPIDFEMASNYPLTTVKQPELHQWKV